MRQTGPILLLIALTLSLLVYYYHAVFFNANGMLFNDTGDGIKNYYAVMSHVKNDTSYVHFQGMNYPYGEVHNFTDGMPLLANTLKFLAALWPSITDYGAGIMNLVLMLALIPCAILVFLILRHFRVTTFMAVLGALAITAMSPQTYRITGHFGLSFSYVIPFAWYMMILFFEGKRHRWLVTGLLAANQTAVAFLHPYLCVMSSFFVIMYWLSVMLLKPATVKPLLRNLPHLLVQGLFALLFFMGYIAIVDHHADRSPEPTGFYEYVSGPGEVLLPHTGPFVDLWSGIFSLEGRQWEGLAYIGQISLLALAYSIAAVIALLVKRKARKALLSAERMSLAAALAAGAVILLYSTGLLYDMTGSVVTEMLPWLKQFRALGRFAWVFYFVVTIYSLWFFDRAISRFVSHTQVAYSIRVLLLAVMFAEALPYHSYVRDYIGKAPNYFLDEYSAAYTPPGIDYGSYQAILPLPFYHIGSENFVAHGSGRSMKYSMLAAYHSSLPVVGALISRSSVSESRRIMQLLSPGHVRKEIEEDLGDRRDFLVVYSGEALAAAEQRIAGMSLPLYETDSVKYFRLPFDSLFGVTAAAGMLAFERVRSNLHPSGALLLTDTSDTVLHKTFDGLPSQHTVLGSGALEGHKDAFTFLISPGEYPFETGRQYSVSFWYHNGTMNALTGAAVYFVQTKEDGVAEWVFAVTPSSSYHIVNGWSLVEFTMTANETPGDIAVFITGPRHDASLITVDELLVRPAGTDAYRVLEEDKRRRPVAFSRNNAIIRAKD